MTTVKLMSDMFPVSVCPPPSLVRRQHAWHNCCDIFSLSALFGILRDCWLPMRVLVCDSCREHGHFKA
jgi:hypothetical protein